MPSSRVWTTLAAQFKASPGKTGCLGLLAVVLVVMVARLASRTQSAGAATPAGGEIDTTLIPDVPAVAASAPRPPLPDLPDRLARDLFAASWSRYVPVPVPASDAEDPTDTADPPEEDRPILTLDLTLTATDAVERPYAVINGTPVSAGDWIGGYMVESIAPGVVILSATGRDRVALRMR